MIPTHPIAKAVALGAALAVHGAIALALATRPDPVSIEAAAGPVAARLGNSFADFAAGTLRPVTPTTQPLAAATPKVANAAQPVATAPAEQPAPVPGVPVAPQAKVAMALPEAAATPAPQAPAPAAAPSVTRPPPPAQVLRAEPEVTQNAPETAPRPRARPDREPAAAPVAPGTAPRSARAGSATGDDTARATQTGGGGQSGAQGNAAVSSYPGKVMQRIARVRRPSVGARGAALVAFTVTGSGGLGSARIARSSGSAALDRAALLVVQRAAPFPKPPAGAQRSFSIQIKGR